ncbi:MAG: HAD hydrolase-like protein [bacterium]|nr:HAD hydrolase-like protein [bacterium]
MPQRCSFCRVPDNKVDRLVYGAHFNICSDCIRTCLAVLDGEDITGWAITTSPQRCDNCAGRPTEGYRHLLNRATYSPRVCERCLLFYTEVLLKEMPTLDEELQNIIKSVFDTDDRDEDNPPEIYDPEAVDPLEDSPDKGPPLGPLPDQRELGQKMQGELTGQTRETIADITRQAIEELERRPERGGQTATQTEPDPLATDLDRPLGILFDLGDTLLRHLRFDPGAGTEALLKLAHNPEGHSAQVVIDRIEMIHHDLVPRREHAQVEFHPHLMQRHVFEALNITFDRDHGAVERVFWRNSMKWEHEPGVVEMLEKMRDLGIPMGIVSNAEFSGNTLYWELEQQGLADYFRFLMSSADYWVRKPHRLLMDTAAAKLGLPGRDVWHVGNSGLYDIGAARNAGMGAIWYNHAKNPNDGPEPHVEIECWDDFVILVEKFLE